MVMRVYSEQRKHLTNSYMKEGLGHLHSLLDIVQTSKDVKVIIAKYSA